jgi:hypothetical protein
MCRIKKCKGKVFAKGLCVKHYTRERRHGDPMQVSKLGRPPLPITQLIKQFGLDAEWSPRTIARYRKAMQLLNDSFERDAAAIIRKEAIRSNGKINVCKLLDLTERILARRRR